MKITYVVHQFLPRYFTGTEQYVFAIASRMQSAGHDVEVFCLEPDFSQTGDLFSLQRDTERGLSVVRVRFFKQLHRDWHRLEFSNPFMSDRFGRYLEERKPDVVHLFHARYLGADLLEETERLGIRTLVHLMDFWFLCPTVTLMMRDGSLCEGPPEGGLGCADCVDPWLAEQLDAHDLRGHLRKVGDEIVDGSPGRTVSARAATLMTRPRFMVRQLLRAERILAPSRFLKEMFVRNGVPGSRIDVVPYGVDGVGRKPEAAGEDVPASIKARLTVGFLGSVAPHKGVHLLIEAVRRAPGDIRLSIHGRTSDFPDYSKQLRDLAAGDERVKFHGPYPREALGTILAAMDVLVLPSLWYENTPFVVLEAFAAGTPVVATDVGGLAEIVQHGVNGELFRRGDAADLARCLQGLVDNPERLARYRDGIPEVETLDANVRELEAMYRGGAGS